MTDFLVKRDDLRECRSRRLGAAGAGARAGAAAGRQLRPDREQHHLRGDGRGDVLLGLLPRRRRAGGGCRCGASPRSSAARPSGVEAGTRVYGYLPPSSHLLVTPASVDAAGFVDGSPHRAALPSAYHRYLATGARPLLPRGDRGDPDAAAAALLHLLPDRRPARRRGPGRARADPRSPAPRARPRSPPPSCWPSARGSSWSGSPHRAAPSSSTALRSTTAPSPTTRSTRSSAGPATYVDIAGDAAVRQAVHSHFGDELLHSMAVGVTHWEEFERRRRRAARADADLLLRPRPGHQAGRGLGPRRARAAGSPRPGTRSASGPAAGWRRSPARASRASGPPTSTCSRGASTRPAPT